MEDVSRTQGRTILYVSHNMPSVINLCERTILLVSGQTQMDGKTSDVFQAYLMTNKSKNGEVVWETRRQRGKRARAPCMPFGSTRRGERSRHQISTSRGI